MMSVSYRVTLAMMAAAIIVGMLLPPITLAHDLNIDFLIAADSNPNELPESIEYVKTAVAYGKSKIELSHTPAGTGFYYQLEAESSLYQDEATAISNPKHAEETSAHADLGFAWQPGMKHGRARYAFEVNYSARDATLVDNNTGDIAVFSGEPVGDRFDGAWGGASISGIIPISEEAFFVFDLDAVDKQYEDYQLLGLSNLDYLQYDLDMGFEKWIWPRTNLVTMIGAGVRQYVDRRARDDQGIIVANSNLEYTFLEVENTLEYNITDRWQWKLGFAIDQSKDNEDGYYDNTQAEAFTGIQYLNGNHVKFVFKAAYLHGRFDNDNYMIDILDEETRDNEGFRVNGEFVRNMYQWTRIPFDLIFGVEAESYENANPAFSYDRGRVYFGVRWRPFDLPRK